MSSSEQFAENLDTIPATPNIGANTLYPEGEQLDSQPDAHISDDSSWVEPLPFATQQEPDQASHTMQSEQTRVSCYAQRATMAILATCVSLVAITPAHSEGIDSQPRQQRSMAQLIPDSPLPTHQEVCPPVTADAQRAAQKLLDAPENPSIQKYLSLYGEQRQVPTPLRAKPETNQFQRPLDTVAQESATKYGLTLHPLSPEHTLLEDRNPNTVPFAEYYTDARDYLSKFGIDLVLHEPGKTYAYGGQETTPQDQETKLAKQNLMSLVDGFSTMPQEYVDLFQPTPDTQRKVYLVGHSTMGALIIDGYAGKGEIAYNITTGLSEDTVRHEMFHEVDGTLCGGASGEDPGYAKQGGNAPYTGDKWEENTSTLSELDMIAIGSNKSTIKTPNPTSNGRCALEDQMNEFGQTVNFASAYASTNIVEDKAETGLNLSSGDKYTSMLSNMTPIIKAKFSYLFARLYQYRPALAYYFADQRRVMPPTVDCHEPEPTYSNKG